MSERSRVDIYRNVRSGVLTGPAEYELLIDFSRDSRVANDQRARARMGPALPPEPTGFVSIDFFCPYRKKMLPSSVLESGLCEFRVHFVPEFLYPGGFGALQPVHRRSRRLQYKIEKSIFLKTCFMARS